MIEAQRHAEIFADGYLPVDDTWLLSDAAQGKIKGLKGASGGNCEGFVQVKLPFVMAV